jgi:hypothetical protein
MDELFARIWFDMAGRVTGPMSFRLLLQPTVAAILAIRAGLKDAREGHPLYGWSILTDPAHRVEFLREGWKAVAKVFCLALVLDVIYQVIAIGWVYPVEALVVAFLLAFVPYLLIRGPVNRLFRSRAVHPRTDHP